MLLARKDKTMATFFTVAQIKDHALIVNDTKGASYTRNDKAGTSRLYTAIITACDELGITKVESRKDFSLGHLAEGVHNCCDTWGERHHLWPWRCTQSLGPAR